jgi:hypothetical protein
MGRSACTPARSAGSSITWPTTSPADRLSESELVGYVREAGHGAGSPRMAGTTRSQGTGTKDDGSVTADQVPDQTLRAVEPFLRGAVGPATGTDSTGRIEATLDRAGHPRTVRIDARWSDDLDVQALGPAVIEALQAAGMERVRQWGERVGEQSATTPTSSLEPPEAFEPRPGAPRAPDAGTFDRIRDALLAGRDEVPPEMAAAMIAALRELNDSLDTVRGEVRASVAAGFVGRSPDGHVEATVNGAGDPVSLRYDDVWLPRAHVANIAHQTVEAFAAARTAAAGHDPGSIVAGSAVGRVASLLEDPEAFVASLGLPPARPTGTSS